MVTGSESKATISQSMILARAQQSTGIDSALLSASYNAIREEIFHALEEGHSVSLRGFGTFKVKARQGGTFDVSRVALHTSGEGTDPSTVTERLPPTYGLKFVPARVAQARLRQKLPPLPDIQTEARRS